MVLHCPKCDKKLKDAGNNNVQCHSCQMLWPERFLRELLIMDKEEDETE